MVYAVAKTSAPDAPEDAGAHEPALGEQGDHRDHVAERREPWTNIPTTNGVRVPTRSTNTPAGAFANSRENRFALRMTPTRNGEMPRTAPRFGEDREDDAAAEADEERRDDDRADDWVVVCEVADAFGESTDGAHDSLPRSLSAEPGGPPRRRSRPSTPCWAKISQRVGKPSGLCSVSWCQPHGEHPVAIAA